MADEQHLVRQQHLPAATAGGFAGGRKLPRLRSALSQGPVIVLLCACRLSWLQDAG